MSEVQHEIKAVAKRTGLSAHVIRVWEKRYGAVKPARTGTNRRLYSEQDVQRLELLRHATRAGHNIGQAVKLPTEKLREIVTQTPGQPLSRKAAPSTGENADVLLVNECLAEVKQLDTRTLDRLLERGAVRLGQMGFLNRIAAPLSQRVGELWRSGELSAAHEHFLSAALRTFLGHAVHQYAASDSAPCVVVATPSGQLHELGAVMASAVAANLGWRVTFLGTSLPAAEIAGAAIQNKAHAVALSVVYPDDDATLPDELANLRRFLPVEIRIIAGGRAAESYRDGLNRIGAIQVADLNELALTLDQLRKRDSRS